MVYATIIEKNITTISGLFVYVSEQVSVFIPFMILSLFVITFMATYYSQQRIKGYANLFACMSVAGYFVSVVSIIMSFIPNLINPFVVVVCIATAVIGTALLLNSED